MGKVAESVARLRTAGLAVLLAVSMLPMAAPPAAAQAPGVATLVFVDQPQNTGLGLPFVPVVRVQALDATGAPVSGAIVELSVQSNPAGVRLDNGPGQGANPRPRATTNAQGVAGFPGMAIVADAPSFMGTFYRLTATSGSASANSETFFVGKTSPPWWQFNFNAQRTGWSPNTADFSTTRSIMARINFYTTTTQGDIPMTPLLADLNSDGVLDVVAANVHPTVAAGPFIVPRAFSLATGVPIQLWQYGGVPTYLAWSGGSDYANMAIGYLAGTSSTPYVALVHTSYDQGEGLGAIGGVGDVILLTNTGTLASQWSAGSGTYTQGIFPMGYTAPLVANVAASGAPALVFPQAPTGGSTGIVGATAPSGAITQIFTGTVANTLAAGLSIASAEMRSTNSVPEVVAAASGRNIALEWGAGWVVVCAPNSGAAGCGSAGSDQVNTPDVAPQGVSLSDLDDDGRMDIVALGLRSPAAQPPAFPTPQPINVWRGTSNPITLANRLTFAGDGELMTTAALGRLDSATNQGRADIVAINYGAPAYFAGGPDVYGNAGNVQVRDLNAAATAVQDQGRWTRPSGESISSGILLDLDADLRPDLVFGDRTNGQIVAARVTDSSTLNPPAPLWSMGNLGTNTASDPTQGVPLSPLSAGDVTGDCRAEIFAGLSGGSSGRGEIAVLRGADATFPGAPSFTSPIDYTNPANWPANNPPFAPGPYGTSPGGDYPNPSPRAKLAWNAPASNGGLPIVEYKVWRSTDPGFTSNVKYVGVWPSGTPPTPTNPFIDHSSNPLVVNPVDAETVSQSSTFYYRVAAVTCYTLPRDPANYAIPGASRLSAPAQSEVRLPASPTGALRLTPYGDPAYAATPGFAAVRLQWDVVPWNGNKPVGCQQPWGYNVYRKPAAAPDSAYTRLGPPGVTAPFAPGTVAAWDDTTVTKGQDYRYRVVTVNCVGESPGFIQGYVDVRLPGTVSVSATPAGTTVTLSWLPPLPTGCVDAANPSGWTEGYRVYRGTAPGLATYHATVLPSGATPTPPAPWRWSPGPLPTAPSTAFQSPVTFLDYGLTLGTTYYYQVAAVNCVGEGPRSAEVAATASGSQPPLLASLTPASATGVSSTTFTVTPSITSGTPPYSCSWSVSPPGGTFTPPGGAAACTGSATFTNGAGGTTYAVILSVTDSAGQSAVRTSTLAVNPPVSIALSRAPAYGPPSATFTVTPEVTDGLGPYSCSWSVSPPGGTFTPPTGADSCTSPATFKGGAVGVTYQVTATVVDSATPSPGVDTASAYLDVRPNAPPVAEFSIPMEAQPGQPVTFTESSYDPDGVVVSWMWEFGDGRTSMSISPRHTFETPGTYRVRLTVTDDWGELGHTDRDIAVAFATSPPPQDRTAEAGAGGGSAGGSGGGESAVVADAGPDLVALEGSAVVLQAREVAGHSYVWRQTGGPAVDLVDANRARATFRAPTLSSEDPLVLRFALQVSSGGQVSPLDTVEVVVRSANHPPVAEAGADQEVGPGAKVTLESASWDANGDALSHRWRQVEGAPVTLSNPLALAPTFTAPREEGMLRFELEVADGRAVSVDTVTVWVRPAAKPTVAIQVAEDGNEPGRFTFQAAPAAGRVVWDFGDGSPPVAEASPTHVYAKPGEYEVRLTVQTASGEEASAVRTVSVPAIEAQEDSAGTPWLPLTLALVAVAALVGGLAIVARARRRAR